MGGGGRLRETAGGFEFGAIGVEGGAKFGGRGFEDADGVDSETVGKSVQGRSSFARGGLGAARTSAVGAGGGSAFFGDERHSYIGCNG